MSDFDARHLRDVFGTFATGIAVVTTRDQEGKPVAMTVNSFASVSLDPPLVLWSLDRKSDLFEAFSQAEHYAVHILRADQESASTHFSIESEDKFAGVDYAVGLEDLPLLQDYCARLQCRVEHRYEGGDHVILVGRVLETDHRPAEPLIFHAGRYRRLSVASDR